MLFNKGAIINARKRLFGTAPHEAAMNGQKEVLEMLFAKGAKINDGGLIGPAYKLFNSAGLDESKTQEILVKKRINMSVWGDYYGTALQAAAAKGHKEIVQLLLDKGTEM